MTTRSEVEEWSILWAALPMVGVSMSARSADVADAARFVLALGPDGVARFEREVAEFHDVAQTAGVASRVAAYLESAHSRRVTPDLIRKGVEFVGSCGRDYFAMLTENPDEEIHAGVPDASLAESLARLRASPIVDVSSFSDKIVPLRKDGRTWISASFEIGVGIDGDTWPFNGIDFDQRFYRLAAIASQERRWQQLREGLRIREIDIIVQHRLDANLNTEPKLIKRGSRRIDVSVMEHLPKECDYASKIEAGDAQAHALMDRVYAVLSA